MGKGDEARSSAALVHQNGILLGIEQADLFPGLLKAIVCIVSHLGRLALGSFFGGDKDDAVSSTAGEGESAVGYPVMNLSPTNAGAYEGQWTADAEL